MIRFVRYGIVISMLFCLVSVLSGCNKEFEKEQGIEYHFVPEEYSEDYNVITDTIVLDSEKEYRIKWIVTCEQGELYLVASYTDKSGVSHTLDLTTPHSETTTILKNTVEEISYDISITPETSGNIVIDVYSK